MKDSIDIVEKVIQSLDYEDLLRDQQFNEVVEKTLNNALAQETSELMLDEFKNLGKVIRIYIKEFDNAYNRFLGYNRLKKQINDPQNFLTKSGKASVHPLKSLGIQNRQTKTTQDFIKIFEQGRTMLNTIRSQITNQVIETEITIIGEDGSIYRAPLQVLQEKGIVKTVLSTFGGRQTSIFSLAYDIQLENSKEILEEYLIGDLKNANGNESFTLLWEAKLNYLNRLSKKTGKNYSPFFDSKDAEIYNLITARNLKSLSVASYSKLRGQTGKGYSVSSLKIGDVGLKQDKLVTSKTNQVNFSSFSLVRKNLLKLADSFETVKSTEQLRKVLLKEFTVDISKLKNNGVDKRIAREAINTIKAKIK